MYFAVAHHSPFNSVTGKARIWILWLGECPKTGSQEVDWPTISKELEEKVGHIDNMDLLSFDQVIFLVRGVKISFYVSDKIAPAMTTLVYLGNIKLASIEAILAMKLEVMLRRMKFRDIL